MPRKPKPGDFIPRELITSKELLERIRATAKDQAPDTGRWEQRSAWASLMYSSRQTWCWSNLPPKNPITPKDVLGPEEQDWLKPGMWVQIKTVNGLKKRWYVGKNSDGASVIEIPERTDYTEVGTHLIHPIPDPVQAAMDKLREKGHTDNSTKRLVEVLNDLGLLKE